MNGVDWVSCVGIYGLILMSSCNARLKSASAGSRPAMQRRGATRDELRSSDGAGGRRRRNRGASAWTRLMPNQLFGVTATGYVTYTAVALLLTMSHCSPVICRRYVRFVLIRCALPAA